MIKSSPSTSFIRISLSEVSKSKGRPSIRLSYEALMTRGIDQQFKNDCLREYIHHWQHYTGKKVEKDDVFWAKANEVGYNSEIK